MISFHVLRFKILLISTLIPICLQIFFFLSLCAPDYTSAVVSSWCTRMLQGLAVIEIAFFVYYQATVKRLSNLHPLPKPQLSPEDYWTLFINCMDSIKDIQSYISGWFCYCDFALVKRGDILRFLSWAFFVSKPEEVTEQQEIELARMITHIEDRYNVHFEEGDNHLKCMRLNFDPVDSHYRPFYYYLVIFLCQKAGLLFFLMMGFKKYRSVAHPLNQTLLYSYPPPKHQSNVNYYFRPAKSATNELPLVFIHGVGVGLFAYAQFLREICGMGDRALFVIELPHVSTLMPIVYQTFVEQIISPREFAIEIGNILDYHRVNCAVFAGHSMGSTVLSWCVKFIPERVSRAVFLDPVCFLLHHPDVAYNFVYRTPVSTAELFFYYFASREMNIAWFLGRGFVWYDNVLFESDLKRSKVDVRIVLSEKDCIVPNSKVVDVFGANRDITIIKGINHAEFMAKPKIQKQIIDLIFLEKEKTCLENDSGYFSQ